MSKITPEQRETLDLSRWDVAFDGAEPLHHETIENFSAMFAPCGFRREALYPCYGLAEATLLVSGSHKSEPPTIRTFCESDLESDHLKETFRDSQDARTFVGCGPPHPDHVIMIVHPDSLTPCLPDQIGEIWISSPSVAQGYWNRPEETEETFRARLFLPTPNPSLNCQLHPPLRGARGVSSSAPAIWDSSKMANSSLPAG